MASEYDSGYCQALCQLNAHIKTQVLTPNSQTKKIVEIIILMLEKENDTPTI